MAHRIREAMAPAKHERGPAGGEGKIVEADETYIGGKEKNKHAVKRHSGRGGVGKQVAFALVERGGKVRSYHVPNVTGETLRPIIVTQISRDSALMTDEAGQYRHVGAEFARHGKVNHGIGEYVRGEAHTNTVEGYFSILKRGIVGTYHSVSEAHLKRYLGEFDFRYNHREAVGINDTERTDAAIAGTVGKRLKYHQANEATNAQAEGAGVLALAR
ncbi:MAG TPA: IS1595 family transposase [Parvularcula sp.]|nr:IS1595 family transposase [Parvularcula sp.]